ncbi:GNAT family acetyltransferase [Pseudomonas shirazensis]|uniref:GNAT family acetyltransferase n=1 Tax=Pseudomonas shirazensis TaxID=2745494 RepID=UPI003D2A44A6
MEIRLLHGAAIAPYIAELGQLRLQVLREYPFLYDATPQDEATCLGACLSSERSLLVMAQDQGGLVGAALGLPLTEAAADIQAAFSARGHDPAKVFYFAQSVVLPGYRGQGLGVRFFIEREAYAHKLGDFDCCAFYAVERPGGHPLRPAEYKPLHGFWRNRGFCDDPSLRMHASWRDVHQPDATVKQVSFWLKQLTA